MMQKALALSVVLVAAGCARLDHVQIGDIDQSQGKLKPISVAVSQTGFDASETASLAGSFADSSGAQDNWDDLAAVLALINMGPTTGNPVYNDQYAQNIFKQLQQACPSGKITAIRSIREARDGGPISGEIVRIDADCIL